MLAGVDINRYAYAGNDPVNLSDPNGHSYGSSQIGGRPDNINGKESERESKRQRERMTVLIQKTGPKKKRGKDPWRDWAFRAAAKYARPGDENVIEDITSAGQFQKSLSLRKNARDLVVIGHAGRTAIHFNQDAVPGSNLSNLKGPNNVSPNDIDWSSVSSDGQIHLWGCNSGSQPDPIGQHVADAAKRVTKAYSNFTKIDINGPVTNTSELFERSDGQMLLRSIGFNYDFSLNGWSQTRGGLESFTPSSLSGGW